MPTPNQLIPLPCADGLTVEAVYYGSGTLCVSSQAGCAVGCPFCASGSRGLLRNLTVEEMAEQVEACRRRSLTPQRVTVSGIGEPLHNWPTVSAFLARCQRDGLPVSITTTGAPLERFAELLHSEHNGVMLSLHGADAATHRRLVPRGPDFRSLTAFLTEAQRGLTRRQRRKLGINYLLLAGNNDRDDDQAALAELLADWPDLTLHLLACNAGAAGDYQTDPARLDAWHAALTARGVHVRRPNRWRVQPEGGCGTLFIKTLNDREGRTDG